jgi:hypothetical protein
MASNANEDEETRPLLPTAVNTNANRTGSPTGSSGVLPLTQSTIPSISTAVEKLRFEALHSNTDDFELSNALQRDSPLESLNEWQKASYTLCVLLSFRQWYHELLSSNGESWEVSQWRRSNPNIALDLDAEITRKWKDLQYETSMELGQLLWTDFPLKEESPASVRRMLMAFSINKFHSKHNTVIDLFTTSSHEDIICDPTLEQYLFRTWKKGIPSPNATNVPSESRIISLYDSLAKPRYVFSLTR